MSMVLVDTHVLHWWSAEPERMSSAAARALDDADELAALDLAALAAARCLMGMGFSGHVHFSFAVAG